MKAFRLALLASAVLIAPASLAFSQECAKQPVTVGFLPKLDTDPYFKVAQQGAEQAAREIGGKAIQVAPSQATAEAQIEFINSLVSQKVGVIAISANDANAVAPALKRAAQQGVRVVSYDSDVAGAARSIFVNQAKGDSLAEMMLESAYNLIGGEGEFAILSSAPTATNQNAWIDFMKKKMAAEPKFAKMKLVQVAYGEQSEQINQQQALALVQAFPNLKEGDHCSGRHWPAGGCTRAGGSRHDRQGQADWPRSGDTDLEIHQGRRRAGHLVECFGPRLPDLPGRPGACAVQDHRQGRRQVHRRPARRIHDRR
jgi:rhamnose transport system substrate-binding protein